MTGLERLRSAFEAFAAGRATPKQDTAIRAAIAAGDVQILTGERAAQIGRDANGATIVTGNRNIVLSVTPGDVADLLKALAPERRRVDHLPADLPDFEGREAEIEKICTALRVGGQAAITAIGGMGGVGKSALAVHVAHLLNDAAPDGRILVEMGGTSGKPLSPAEAMVKVVATLDPERQVPKEEDAARQAYRAALDGRRVLLLLDNAENSVQVRPLLDWLAPGTMVIATSRRTLAAPGLKAVDLDVMAPDEARALLRSAMGERTAGEDELDLIAERCGRLPLALRVAGTYLALNPQLRSTRYLEALADEKKRLAFLKIEDDATLDVFAALGLSAKQLAEAKPELEARWRLLAVFPASFDAAATAAVWEVETEVAEQDLGALRRRSMVLYDPADDRWRLHDLMRDVAQVPLDEQDQVALAARLEAARARHARHYCDVLSAADDLYLKGGEAVLAGLAFYDLEQRNIAAGQAWAAAQIEQDDAAARLAADYADAGAYFLALRLHPRERIEWLKAQRQACIRLGDRRGEGNALGNLGGAWVELREARRAIEFYEQRLVIAREIGDRRGEGAALSNLGLAWTLKAKDPRRAIEFYKQALTLLRELGDKRAEGSVLGNLGIAHRHLGEPQRAIEFHGQQLAVVRGIGDQLGEGNALANWALALDQLGERAEAVQRARAALAVFEVIGAKHLVEKVRTQLEAWDADDTSG